MYERIVLVTVYVDDMLITGTPSDIDERFTGCCEVAIGINNFTKL